MRREQLLLDVPRVPARKSPRSVAIAALALLVAGGATPLSPRTAVAQEQRPADTADGSAKKKSLLRRAWEIVCPDVGTARSRGAVPEGTWPRRPRPVVRADLTTATFDSVLPFDRRFVVRVVSPDPAVVTRIDMLVTDPECLARLKVNVRFDPVPDDCQVASAADQRTSIIAAKEFAFNVDTPLEPNRAYRFEFILTGNGKEDRREIVAWATTDFRDRFDTDFGALVGQRTGYVGLGSFVHFYFEPIRPREDLREVRSCRRRWAKRANLAGGLSLVEVHGLRDLDQPVRHRFAYGTPAVGVGLRQLFGTPVRFTAGVMWLRQDDANPLVTDDRNKTDLFGAVTFDADLKTLLGPIYGIIGLK